jgi:Tfp pilus assembly protein PilP
MNIRKPVTVLAAFLAAASAFGQTPTAPRPEANNPAPAPFAYDSGGRRDPFKDLYAATAMKGKKAVAGIADLAIDDVTLMGIVGMRQSYEAIVVIPEGFPLTIHEGDRLADGFVLSIGPDRVVLRRTHDSRGVPLPKPIDVVRDIIEERSHD